MLKPKLEKIINNEEMSKIDSCIFLTSNFSQLKENLRKLEIWLDAGSGIEGGLYRIFDDRITRKHIHPRDVAVIPLQSCLYSTLINPETDDADFHA